MISHLHTFTGAYNPGDVITIGAEGQIDNDAPYGHYQFIPISVSVPSVPTISSSNGLLLCNGASTTVTANGTTGTVYWNTGAVGTLIRQRIAAFACFTPASFEISHSNTLEDGACSFII